MGCAEETRSLLMPRRDCYAQRLLRRVHPRTTGGNLPRVTRAACCDLPPCFEHHLGSVTMVDRARNGKAGIFMQPSQYHAKYVSDRNLTSNRSMGSGERELQLRISASSSNNWYAGGDFIEVGGPVRILASRFFERVESPLTHARIAAWPTRSMPSRDDDPSVQAFLSETAISPILAIWLLMSLRPALSPEENLEIIAERSAPI